MTNHIADISLRKAATAAGFGLLVMTIMAIFANFFVIESLIVPGDAVITANNIMAHELLFRFAICSFIIVIILDVIVAWALYIFLKPVHRSLSLLTAWFRIVYATIFGVSLFNLVTVLGLLHSSDYAQIMISLNAFNDGWNIGLVFFGIHLGLLGYLVLKSNYIPKFLSVLLVIAGLGYLMDSFGKILIPDYNATIAMFTFIGELLLMLWLLIKGGKIKLD